MAQFKDFVVRVELEIPRRPHRTRCVLRVLNWIVSALLRYPVKVKMRAT